MNRILKGPPSIHEPLHSSVGRRCVFSSKPIHKMHLVICVQVRVVFLLASTKRTLVGDELHFTIASAPRSEITRSPDAIVNLAELAKTRAHLPRRKSHDSLHCHALLTRMHV
jgi:hypothetical protein